MAQHGGKFSRNLHYDLNQVLYSVGGNTHVLILFKVASWGSEFRVGFCCGLGLSGLDGGLGVEALGDLSSRIGMGQSGL